MTRSASASRPSAVFTTVSGWAFTAWVPRVIATPLPARGSASAAGGVTLVAGVGTGGVGVAAPAEPYSTNTCMIPTASTRRNDLPRRPPPHIILIASSSSLQFAPWHYTGRGTHGTLPSPRFVFAFKEP